MRFALIGALILLVVVQLAATGRDIAHRIHDVRDADAAMELKDISGNLLRLAHDSALEQQIIAFTINRPEAASAPDFPWTRHSQLLNAQLDRLEHRDEVGLWQPALGRLRDSMEGLELARPAALAALSLPAVERPAEPLAAWSRAAEEHIAAFQELLLLIHQPQHASIPARFPFQQAVLTGVRLRVEAGSQVMSAAALATGTGTVTQADRVAQERADARIELLWAELGANLAQTGDRFLIQTWEAARSRYFTGFEPLRQAALPGPAAPDMPYRLEQEGAAALNALTGVIAAAVDRADQATEKVRREALMGLAFSLKLLTLWLIAIAVAVTVVRQRVLRPIGRLASAMKVLAAGDTSATVPRISGPGEVAAMADAVQVFKANAHQLRQEVATRQRTERLLDVERQVLEMVANTRPLEDVLAAICLGIEERIGGARCSIQLLTPDGTRLSSGIGPSLPSDYMQLVVGVEIGPCAGSCGTALYRREPVIVSDIANDPLWTEGREVALSYGLRACWSVPFLSADGTPLGAFATYYPHPRTPEPWELDHASRAGHLAAVAIGARRAEDNLRKAMAQAELASRTKSEFLANMSHELRTPLNAIIGFAEVLGDDLRENRNAASNADYAGDIVAAGRHLLQLINDILDVSKMEAGKVELRERICDVAELLAGCERIVRARAMERQLSMEMEVPVGLPPVVVDDVKFKQIILNLLSNSIKFTTPGGAVRITAEVNTATGLCIRVADTGIGIRPEDMEKLFVPFHQIDSVYSRLMPGTGLGLALSRGLAELHGGTLTLESEYGVGTTAILTLPADRLMPPEMALHALRG